MVEELFEYACMIRGSLKRFRSSTELAAIHCGCPSQESKAYAWILAQYLRFMGCKAVVVVAANAGGETFTWVETDGITLDICADRLPGSQTLLVLSEQSVFHSVFEAVSRTRVTQKALDARPDYVSAYEVLLKKNPVLRNPEALEAQSDCGA